MSKKNTGKSQPDYEKILQECFWEYHLSKDELVTMAWHGTEQEKLFLFGKLFENSQDILQSLNLFSTVDQKKMLLRYSPPQFNRQFFEKRYNILKYFILGEDVHIPELQWNA